MTLTMPLLSSPIRRRSYPTISTGSTSPSATSLRGRSLTPDHGNVLASTNSGESGNNTVSLPSFSFPKRPSPARTPPKRERRLSLRRSSGRAQPLVSSHSPSSRHHYYQPRPPQTHVSTCPNHECNALLTPPPAATTATQPYSRRLGTHRLSPSPSPPPLSATERRSSLCDSDSDSASHRRTQTSAFETNTAADTITSSKRRRGGGLEESSRTSGNVVRPMQAQSGSGGTEHVRGEHRTVPSRYNNVEDEGGSERPTPGQFYEQEGDWAARRYVLRIVQQPTTGCTFGSQELYRLQVAPPLVAQLHVYNSAGREVTGDDESPFLVCHVSLLTETGENADMLSPVSRPFTAVATPSVSPASVHSSAAEGSSMSPSPHFQNQYQGQEALRMLYGGLVASPQQFDDLHGECATFFLFPDISVRSRGRYRLNLSLLRIPHPNLDTSRSRGSDVLTSVSTEPFEVVLLRNYVAPHETEFTRHLANQGARFVVPERHRVD